MVLTGNAWIKLMRISTQTNVLIPKFEKRWYKSNKSCEQTTQQNLSQTNIFIQQGDYIHEVPFVVKITNNINMIYDHTKKNIPFNTPHCKIASIIKKKEQLTVHNNSNCGNVDTIKLKKKMLNQRINIETNEGTAILFCSDLECFKESDIQNAIEELNLCYTTKDIYSLLESKINQEINSRLALEGLKKVIELENNKRKQKPMKKGNIDNRDIVLKQLVGLIMQSEDSEMIVQGLLILKKDKFNPSRNMYRDWMCNEALSRVIDGEFSLCQLMNTVKILSSYKDPNYFKSIDILWVGIVHKERDINAELLVPLFKLLKYFDQSNNMVKIILERKLSDHCPNLMCSQISEILDCYHNKISALKCLRNASNWMNLRLSTCDEKDIINLIRKLDKKNYVDDGIEKALIKYMKMKSSEIRDSNLIATLLNYCKNLRIRNPSILSECGKYFIKYGMNIPTPLLSSILTPFGLLYVEPPNNTEFWKVFDQILLTRFYDLKLNDTLDILLSCIYLEKYPIQHFDEMFASYICNTLYQKKNIAVSNTMKNKLKLLDAAMSLECRKYEGLQVPLNDTTSSLFVDTRIRRMINIIYQPLTRLVGGEQKLSKNVILNRLPLTNFYVLDILIHPFLVSTPVLHLNLQKNRNINTALLINLPEHYCRNTNHLIGPQVMKKRHIKKLGFRVTSVDYVILEELLKNPKKLSHYLLKSLDSAEDAL